jgi:hypothetical protein
MKQTLKEQNWEKQFKQEFGIHFSESELQFAVSFIDDLLKEEKEKWEEEYVRDTMQLVEGNEKWRKIATHLLKKLKE